VKSNCGKDGSRFKITKLFFGFVYFICDSCKFVEMMIHLIKLLFFNSYLIYVLLTILCNENSYIMPSIFLTKQIAFVYKFLTYIF